ncbi:MAG: hypothetical protein JW828_16780 [Sedimentisphaerales bacterium]|nr:hypothetical protein [Sedimentisphaerales bacterium]
MSKPRQQYKTKKRGSVLGLAMVLIAMLSVLGAGVLMVSFGASQQTAMIQSEAAAISAAEAGYEKAIFWMSKQTDMLSALEEAGASGTLDFGTSSCDYQIGLTAFIGSSPVYEITSVGSSGRFNRTLNVQIIQAVGGWSMGMCRIPSGSSSTSPVSYAAGEVIDMPIHINSYGDPQDAERDISLSGDPLFLRSVSMSESRYSSGGYDKYKSVLPYFDNGIYFNQPSSRITDAETVQTKIDRFVESTNPQFRYTPAGEAKVKNPQPAVHLEFFVDGGKGKLRITNNCTVRGFRQSSDSRTYDFKIYDKDPSKYERYFIYGYHLRPKDADADGGRFVINLEDTYVTQSIAGMETEPGGQIYVDGNVIIGSGDEALAGVQDVVNGRITVVASGNIWIADSITVDGSHEANGLPSQSNTNVLGLVAQGVIKVVDPGMPDYSYVDDEPDGYEADGDYSKHDHIYVPVARRDSGYPVGTYKRHLPDPTVVEAAVTVGGGGWGAENVQRGSYGGRKESGTQDDLVLRGTIAESMRGVVGLIGADGYLKQYYMDERLLTGILPGNIWLRGKYVPLPAGWRDYRASND